MDEKARLNWNRCVEFHGHSCPGLAIGFRAVQIALKALEGLAGEPYNPEIGMISIVQNDTCGVDAVQTLLSTTFGKGNLMFMDHGKQVYRFVRRQDGRGIRVALIYGATDNERHNALRVKLMSQKASAEEQTEFSELRNKMIDRILEAPSEEIFSWREIKLDLPSGPKLNATLRCSFCGEGVMEQRVRVVDGRFACLECAEPYESRVLVLNK